MQIPYYPLTSTQREIWFDQQLHPNLPLYNIGGYVDIPGCIDPVLFAQAANLLVQKHDNLRTILLTETDNEGVPFQGYVDCLTITVPTQDFSMASDPQAAATAWMQTRFVVPFVLENQPLFRYDLLKLGENHYFWLLQYHHLIVDGWGIALLNRSLAGLYRALVTGETPDLQAPSYIPWIMQDQAYVKSSTFEKNQQYWLACYSSIPEPLLSPRYLSRYTDDQVGSGCETLALPRMFYQQLDQFAKLHRVSLFHVLIGALYVYFTRINQRNDFAIGLPVLNRANAVFKQTAGLFTGVSPAWLSMDCEQSFIALIQYISASLKQSYRHQRYPISALNRLVGLEQPGSPLFDVHLSFENHDNAMDFAGIPGHLTLLLNSAAQTPLTLFVRDFHADQAVCCDFVYNDAYFNASDIQAMQARFVNLLDNVLTNGHIPINQLPVMSAVEQQQLIAWNATTTEYRKDQTVVTLFESQVADKPDKMAVYVANQGISYGQLNAQANQIAHYLLSLMDQNQQSVIQSDTLVGLCVTRSLDMLVGLLGILKAGAAYVPLDPDYPQDRIQYLLEDSQVPVLLTQHCLQAQFTQYAGSILYLDQATDYDSTQPPQNLQHNANPHNLAYVIYTSGSTGVPKGVLIEHRSLLNATLARNTYYPDSGGTYLLVSSYAFDSSIAVIWGALCTGGMLHISPDKTDIEAMLQTIQQQAITHLLCVPTLYQALLNASQHTLKTLRHVTLAGESAHTTILVQHRRKVPQATLYNEYGPTENTVWSSVYRYQSMYDVMGTIGQPIANTQLYILDAQHQPLPIGIPGELSIAGAGLARGYLNQPELTNEKFVELTLFGEVKRVYKTGDLARWLADGNLEYLGRLDHQVKLRGFRIELGEIEQVLTQHATVSAAVVVLNECEDNKTLAAYLTLRGETGDLGITKNAVANLKVWLKTQLPDYMLPNRYTVLDTLPLTPNGKIDRKALPTPAVTLAQADYQPPRNGTEQQLAKIWTQVLKRTNISIHDNFFDLGGDSILSIQIVARARQVGVGLSPRDVFQHQTISALAQVVQPVSEILAEQGVVQGAVPLLPIQSQFLEGDSAEPWHYNQAVWLQVPADLDTVALQKAFEAVLTQHDAFRLRYTETTVGWTQCHQTELSPPHQLVEETLERTHQTFVAALEARAMYWQASLDLIAGPLTRLVLFRETVTDTSTPQTCLLWIIHHLIVDGVSWRILLEDLQTAYQQAQTKQPIQLPTKSTSYQAWSEYLHTWRHSAEYAAEATYWQALPTDLPVLPIEKPQGSNQVTDIQRYTLTFAKNLTQKLLEQTPAAYRTSVNDILLSALMLALHHWTGQTTYIIDLESHGRAELAPQIDLSRTLGWFTSLYSVGLSLPVVCQDLGQVIKTIKEQLRAVPHEGLGYGLRQQQGGSLPQGQILFNYLGQFDQTMETVSSFHFTNQAIEQSVSPSGSRAYLLEINGLVVKNQLSLTFNYSNAQYQTATIEQLATDYHQQLQALVMHCQAAYGYTPSDFPLVTLDQARLDQLGQTYQHNIAAIYPLSPMQQGLLFHSLYAPQTGAYITQLSLQLEGQIQPAMMRQAWQGLMDRHSILRTAIQHIGDQAIQIVYQQAELPWCDYDVRHQTQAEQIAHHHALLTRERAQGFDFSKAPLMRIQLSRTGTESWQLDWHHHHILLDGWCLPILFSELFDLYRALQTNQKPTLPPVKQYQHYIAWLAQQDTVAAQTYWSEKLAGFMAPTPIPVLQLARNDVVDRHQIHDLHLTAGQTIQLQQCASTLRITLNTVVQAAWAILLGRYSGETDIVFGVTTSGRNLPLTGIEQMVGLFINTLPLRVDLNQYLPTLLQALQNQQQTDNHYAYTSLVDIQGWSEVPNGVALFDSLLVFENYPVDEVLQGGTHQPFQICGFDSVEETNYPLTLVVLPSKTLRLRLTHSSTRLATQVGARMLEHLRLLLIGIAQEPTTQIAALPLLTAAETAQLQAWNNTLVDYQAELTLIELFETQVEHAPNSPAITYQDQTLTYRQLNIRANQVAHYLQSLTTLDGQTLIQPDTLVGICVERSLAMVIGLLGILKAGAAYVPLDPDYPQARLQYLLENNQVSVVLTQQHLQSRLETYSGIICNLEEVAHGNTIATQNFVCRAKPDNLAYVIYTSGSTGKPKGCLVTHRNMSRLFVATQDCYHFGSSDVWTLFHSYAFDVSVWEIWGALAHGGQLIIVPYLTSRDPEAFLDLLITYQVTVLNQTPSAFVQLMQADQKRQITTALRWVIFAGESLELSILRPWFAQHGDQHPQLMNMYGITETTVHVTYHLIKDQSHPNPTNIIGKPLPDIRAYLLDAHQQPVPIGIPGELYIAGAGLACGYLNQPELTAEKFIKLKLFGKTERVYKTGDLARWLSDGNLEYLGRIDHQIKLRGFRIELGEIETVLMQHDTVNEAVVVMRESETNPALAAYLTASEHSVLDSLGVRDWLKTQLPDYMVPSTFTLLDTLPLTPNGKIDRKALPEPTAQLLGGEVYVAPRNALERQMVTLWQMVLPVEQVGVYDNIFELGGNSVLIVQLHHKLQAEIDQTFFIADFFRYPTIATLARYISDLAHLTSQSAAVLAAQDRAIARRNPNRARHKQRRQTARASENKQS